MIIVLLILLLILSIANNFITYYKYHNLPFVSDQNNNIDDANIGVINAKLYFNKKIPSNKCYPFDSTGNYISDEFKSILRDFEKKYSNNCVIVDNPPTSGQIENLNVLNKQLSTTISY
jgi:biopolymer transport protein ExbD